MVMYETYISHVKVNVSAEAKGAKRRSSRVLTATVKQTWHLTIKLFASVSPSRV